MLVGSRLVRCFLLLALSLGVYRRIKTLTFGLPPGSRVL